jgi:hypothetical protein
VSPLYYLYAVTGSAPPELGPGVGGAAVTAVAGDGLVAVVSEVAAAEFGEQPLAANLRDLDWLESAARAHHAVVDGLAAAGPVLPLRLATVFDGPGAVRELLRERRAELSAALARIRGRREWGVKAYAVPTAAAGEPEAPAADRPGTAYLMRKRGRRDAAERTVRAAEQRAAELHTALAGLADAARRYPPQDPRLSGRREPMALNASYLVAADREAELAGAAVDRPGLLVELTGPWAPYSFAELDGGPAAEQAAR